LSFLLFNRLTESCCLFFETLTHPDIHYNSCICFNWIHHIATKPIKKHKPQSLTSWNWASLNRRVHGGHKRRWRRGEWQLDEVYEKRMKRGGRLLR